MEILDSSQTNKTKELIRHWYNNVQRGLVDELYDEIDYNIGVDISDLKISSKILIVNFIKSRYWDLCSFEELCKLYDEVMDELNAEDDDIEVIEQNKLPFQGD